MKPLKELGICKGEWKTGDKIPYCENHVVFSNYKDGHTRVVATCNKYFSESDADACLIAAAPEMYEALYEIVQDMCQHCDLLHACEEGEDGMQTHCNQYLNAVKVLIKAAGEVAE